jgi:outer membrane receptor protein involved in Fe transport
MRALVASFLTLSFLLSPGPARARQGPAPSVPPSTVPAASAAATIDGIIVDRFNALPIESATVEIRSGTTVVTSASSDASGRYSASVAAGVYSVVFRALGYESVENDEVAVVAGSTAINVSLSTASTNSKTTLSTIGHVSANSHSLSAATSITRSISVQDVSATGQLRVGDELGTLPALNFATSSSVGDDASINLRGFGNNETSVLLDGHPVGPLGIGPGVGNFNIALGPAFGLSSVDVTYGSGAQGLFGSDTIGGAVNFVTLTPTATPHFSFQQQIGGFGTLSTGVTATGSFDRLGYAVALGRLGEYGDFNPHPIAQSARPNNVSPNSVNPNGACAGGNDLASAPNAFDVSACNLGVNTYAVSQNTEQTVGLLKLDYALSPVTHFKVTSYGGLQWSDSTGNGDNDNLPFATRLGQIQSGSTNCTLPSGGGGYQVVTNPIAGTTSCYTAQQFASATSGPDGGGAVRQRSTTMRDYDFSFSTKAGINNITVSAFDNNYQYWKYSSLASGLAADGNFIGTPTFADYYNTQGYLVQDEIDTARNELGFGYTLYHQLQDGIEDDSSGITPHIPTEYFGEGSFFARDTYQLSDQLSLFLNAWVKHSSVSGQTTFDPRATVLFRPTHSDVVQLTYGHSDGAPSPQLKAIGATLATDPGSSLTNVNCNGFNSVTTAGNPSLTTETANDVEAGYGHRFGQDSNVQLNAYVTSVGNQLFSASEPLEQYGIGNVSFAPGALMTYLQRLQTQCPGDGVTLQNIYKYLAVSTTYNASHALVRGLEFSGRQRFAHIAYIDYGYFIESSAQAGIAPQILASNPNVINGAQIAGTPLHQATISLDVAPAPWEFRLDNYYVDGNNPLDRPAYWHTNAFISRNLGHGTQLTLGGTNIFNNAVQDYGYIGFGTAFGTNPYGGPPTPSEEFGINPPSLTLTLQQRM